MPEKNNNSMLTANTCANSAVVMDKVNFIAPVAYQKKQEGVIYRRIKKIFQPTLSYPEIDKLAKNNAHLSYRPHLLKDLTCEIAPGSINHIVGPSGSGKSSFVRLLNRLNEPTSGKLKVLGKSIYNWEVRNLRQKVAFVFQQPSMAGLNVKENLFLPFKLCHKFPEVMDERINEALELVGLDRSFLSRYQDQLSGGQKHRVALARALITRPEILLLDEPTSSLDPPAASALLDRISIACQQRNITLFIVTHRLSEVRQLGGNLAVLIDGQLREFGNARQMLDRAKDNKVNKFLQGKSDESN